MRRCQPNTQQRIVFVLLILLIGLNSNLFAQIGQIYDTGTQLLLDPNSDGYISASGGTIDTSLYNDESLDFEYPFIPMFHFTMEPTADLQTGSDCGKSEIVDNPKVPMRAGYYHFEDPDGIYNNCDEALIFRIRIARNVNGAYGYSFLIDSDSKMGFFGPDADSNAVPGNPGFEYEISYTTAGQGSVKLLDVDGTTNGTVVSNYSGNSHSQRSYAGYTNCPLSDPVFLDFMMPFCDLGLSPADSIRLLFATASSGVSVLAGSASDIGGYGDFDNQDSAFVAIGDSIPIVTFGGCGWALSPVEQDVSCPGAADGEAWVNVWGGAQPISIEWSTGATTDTLKGLSAGTYFAYITSGSGCVDTVAIDISEPLPLSVELAILDSIYCFEGSNGMLSASISGGTAPYSGAWSNGSFLDTISNLTAGGYYYTVVDSRGCTDSSFIQLTQPSPIILVENQIFSVSCLGGADGGASVSVTGGTPNYSFLWSNGSTDSIVTNLSSGNYTVWVTDQQGCMDSLLVNIPEPAATVTANASFIAGVSCIGASDGSAYLILTGGTSPFTYLWSSGETNDTSNALPSGLNWVYVVDSMGCGDTATINITQPDSVLAVAARVWTPISCIGSSDGVVFALASGGTAPYSFSWNTGDTTQLTYGLIAGSYSVTVTDVNGCTAIDTIAIEDPAPFVINAIPNDINCKGAVDGSISVSISGGTSPFSYSWSTGEITSSVSNLGPGNYWVVVTDSNGCTDSDTVSLTEPATTISVSAVIISANPTCLGVFDGVAYALPSDGTAPYSYSWNTGSTNDTAIGLGAGLQIVTITDSLGCTATDSVFIDPPGSDVQVTINVISQIDCYGGSNGELYAIPTGGTAPYTITWNTGFVGDSISGLTSGTYVANLVDAGGCVAQATYTLVNPDSIYGVTGVVPIACVGGNDREARVVPFGGKAPYSFVWDNGQTNDTASSLGTGTHNVTITDSLGCIARASVTITQPATPLSVQLSSSQSVLCAGGTTGNATVSATGGVSPYTYVWSNGAVGVSQNSLGSGNYWVAAIDNLGCSDTVTFTITEPTNLNVVASELNAILCFGSADGSAYVTPSGGTQPYSYSWSTGDTNDTLQNVPSGLYVVTVTDFNGCSAMQSVTITELANAIDIIAYQGAGVSCFGGNDGWAWNQITNGTAPYTYVWSNGSTQDTLSGVSAGNYTVWVTDALGCIDSATVTISQPIQALTLSTSVGYNVSCFGGADGVGHVLAQGGTASYQYLWSDGQTTAQLNSVPVGTYWVYVTDSMGCGDSATVTITGPVAPLMVSTSLISGVNCNGGADGSAGATAVNGTAPFTYLWDQGAITSTAVQLHYGWHSVIITDALGCAAEDSVFIPEPDSSVYVNITINQNVSCFGGADGQLTAVGGGGTPPYSYDWDNLFTGAINSGLGAGTYQVTVTDANGCQDTISAQITQPTTALSLSGQIVQQISCFGNQDGQASASASGGWGGYTFSWTNGGTGTSQDSLSPGFITVTVTDSGGCSLDTTLEITQPVSALAIASSTTTDVTCAGANNGSASVVVGGGTSPYSYAWSNGGTGSGISAVAGGTYTVLITDANGCTTADTLTIAEPLALTLVNTGSQNISCFGDATGSASISVNGGTTPYQINWSNGDNGAAITNVVAGTYTAFVVDSNGCTDSISFTLTQPVSALSATPTVSSNVNCFGGSNGSGYLTITGGTAPYTTSWDNGTTTDTINNLTSGTYTATISDAAGCVTTAQITISQPVSALAIASSTTTDVTCAGANNGSVSVVVGGGTSPYSYAWSNGGTGSGIFAVAGGTYTVLITDANGCTTADTLTIAEPLALTLVNTGSQNISCFGDATGSASISVNGGTMPYSISWSNGDNGAAITNVVAGTYTAFVVDSNGCTDSISFTLTQPVSALSATLSTVSHVTCFGFLDGAIGVSVSGGTGPYSYSWSNGATTDSVFGLSAGSYSLIVTDAAGCTTTLSTSINSPVAALSATANVTDVTCNGQNNGGISLSIGGGEAPYSISWSNGFTGNQLLSLAGGTYSYTVVDARGCTVTGSATIQEPSALVLTQSSLQAITCFGASTGSAGISVSGGTAPYTISWDNGATGSSILNVSAGTFVATVTDANGCSDTLHFNINQPTNPLAVAFGTVNQVTCFNGADGSTSISVAGGQAPYIINWSNGGSGTSISNLSAGVYTAFVQDQGGCIDSISVTITEPTSALSVQLNTLQNIACYGDASGVIAIAVSGGEAPYSFTWSNGMSADSIFNLTAGSYTVTVMDNRGCSQVFTQNISEPSQALTVATSLISPVICADVDDGSAQVNVSGGTAPYTVLWSNGDTSTTATQLPPGSISVTITDANGCVTTEQVLIIGPLSSLGVTKQVENTKCGVIDNGYVKLTPYGGSGPYNVVWNHGLMGTELLNVTPGKYIFTLMDDFGCELIDSVFVLQTPMLEANITVDTVSCRNAADGAIDVIVTSGIGPFTYLLNGQPFTGNATNLNSGGYRVSIIDGVGCDSTFTVSMSPNDNGMYLHIPNAYTPNQDGLNEDYMIVGSECFENAYFEIVDRWGTLMFRTDKPFMEFWDGRRPDGTIAPQDVYAWRFVARRVKRYGTVSIIE